MALAGHLHPLAAVEALADRIGRKPQLARRQQGPLDVVPALLVAIGHLRVECVGGLAGAGRNHRQGVFCQIVEQGCRHRLRRRGPEALPRRLEEQRQVVLHARRRAARLEVLEQGAAALVQVEALHQRVHGPPARILVQRHLAAGQHVDRLHLVQRAL